MVLLMQGNFFINYVYGELGFGVRNLRLFYAEK
jgi:hypothetical protein